MSAFGIATDDNEVSDLATRENKSPGQLFLAAVGALIKWVPAEVVATYAAVVAAMQPSADAAEPANISLPAWLIFLAATPVLIAIFAVSTGKTDRLAWKIVLSVPAFVLWSASIPASAWFLLKPFNDQTPLALGVLLLVTVAFTALAEKLTKKKRAKQAPPK